MAEFESEDAQVRIQFGPRGRVTPPVKGQQRKPGSHRQRVVTSAYTATPTPDEIRKFNAQFRTYSY